ncbi:MAG: aldehyde dehydrogenase family protein [Janthinobacterium lividum]
MLQFRQQFYIGGAWVEPTSTRRLPVVDPATEEEIAQVIDADETDVNRAVAAAKAAFASFRRTSLAERIALIERIGSVLTRRGEELAVAISREMGAPIAFARAAQVPACTAQLQALLSALPQHHFSEQHGQALVVKEPIGVCAIITPWNFPAQQIVMKATAALAAGCTMVVKPSEMTPLSANLVAEIFAEAGTPPGVFNLIHGRGPTAGATLCAHPDVDMVSFTGSTRAGIAIAQAAAPTIKRVVTELGGKSANCILPDADLAAAVRNGVLSCFGNSGQSCIAPTRMLVHASQREQAIGYAREAAEQLKLGPTDDVATDLGPLANRNQFERVRNYIETGIGEKATLVTGGLERPAGTERGFYVRPTVFADVTPEMTIAREEIFGPVLSIISYRDEAEMLKIANDTPYGLAGYVQSSNPAEARRIAGEIRAGTVQINYGDLDMGAPFGGYKQSGNGREWGSYGLEEFLETKSIHGHAGA